MLLFLLACDGVLTTSSCSYDTTEGACTFTDVTADAQVTFSFVAFDGTVSESGNVVIGDDATAPDQACIDELGIVVDTVVDCDRKGLTEEGGDGGCEAVQWEFDDFDPRDCEH